MKKVTIIGAGFGALTTVRELRKNNAQVEITLIAPKPEFIYFPSLIWIPSGLRSADDVRINLHKFFGKMNVNYYQASVTGLKENGRIAITDQGEVENDALIIASGGRFIKKLPGIENVITICEGIPAAEKMRDQIKAMKSGTIALGFGGNPKEPSAMRGGPMFELLFGLDTQLRRENRRDQFKLVFFNPASQPGKRLGESAVKGLLREMKKRNINTHLGHKIKGFETNKVLTEGGEIEADMMLFMPGMTGAAWFQNSGLPLSEGGMIKANAHCQIEGFEKVYVAGDSGSYPGPEWLPKQAHMADLQAATAVKNLLLEFEGKPATETFKVELICVVDTLNKGILVFRNMKRTVMLPGGWFLHIAKRFFEWNYLRPYR